MTPLDLHILKNLHRVNFSRNSSIFNTYEHLS